MAIPSNTKQFHHIGNSVEDVSMGFRVEDFPHLAELLNSPYSNNILAVLREYATNAWDSHVEAGVRRPIEVTLPTYDSPEVIIEDFGLGMSGDDLRETYAMYGASTKRSSNAIAGMLGIGSKSGLAYSSAFTVTAVKDGERVIAMVTRNERGLGVIKFIDTTPTDAPNGVRITIPVNLSDIGSFTSTANHLFSFWEPNTVLIDGQPPETPAWHTTAMDLDDNGYTRLVWDRQALTSSYVVMGNVPYPVDDVTIRGSSIRFVAVVNIGDVEFVSSREAVKHVPKTDETLADLHTYIKSRYDGALAGELAKAGNAWEEAKMLATWGKSGNRTRLIAPRDTPMRGVHSRLNRPYYRRKMTYTNTNVSIGTLLDEDTQVLVTGYTSTSVPASVRERLSAHFGNDKTFLMIPPGTSGVGMLVGRRNVISWKDFLLTTKADKAGRSVRGPQEETQYRVIGRPGFSHMTAKELAALTGKVLYLMPGEKRYNELTLDAEAIVMLHTPKSQDRLKRLIPGLIHYYDEFDRYRLVAYAAITADDRLHAAVVSNLNSVFTYLDHTAINDDELARLIEMSSNPRSAAAETLLKTYGQVVETRSADVTLVQSFTDSYPLVNALWTTRMDNSTKADLVLYINAKYAEKKGRSQGKFA